MKRGREGACESRCFLIDTPARYFICFNEATAFIPPTSPLPHMLPIPILVGENGLGGKTVALDFHSHLPVHAMLPSTVAKKFGRCNFTTQVFSIYAFTEFSHGVVRRHLGLVSRQGEHETTKLLKKKDFATFGLTPQTPHALLYTCASFAVSAFLYSMPFMLASCLPQISTHCS
jgi:hypothetical protein